MYECENVSKEEYAQMLLECAAMRKDFENYRRKSGDPDLYGILMEMRCLL